MSSTYVPGVCNIGPAERRQRAMIGWIGLGVTVLALVLFIVLDSPWPVRLLVAIPAGLAANGFLQSALHFCVGFAMRGLYNFGDKVGNADNVLDLEMRKADQRKGLQITGLSLLIAAVVVVVAVLLP